VIAPADADGSAALAALPPSTVQTGAPTMANTDPVYGKLFDYAGAVFNVKHPVFGAVGNGTTDDTTAIQAAFTAANSATTSFQATSGTLTGQYVGSAPAVFFPAGRYKISGEIAAGAYLQVISDGAILEQSDATKRHLVFSGAYTVVVDGLKFLGGTSAIDYRNANVNGSYLRVLGCEFQLTRSYAIYTLGTASGDDHLSANLTVSQCKFYNTKQVLYNVCDNALVADCWVQLSRLNFAADTAAFVNHKGVLRFDNMFGVPVMGTGTERLANVRWVDLEDGDFYAIDSRFGGEDAGMALVYVTKPQATAVSQATTYPFVGSAVSILRSWVLSGENGRSDSGVIHLHTSVPQSITYEDNRFNLNPVIVNSGGLDLDSYFDTIPYTQQRFRFTLPVGGAPPAQLLPFANFIDYSQRTDAIPTSGKWAQGQTVERLSLTFGKPVGMACVADGEPGTWGEFGKVSPFPVGPQAATLIAGSKAKISFAIRARSFVAIITVTTNPNLAGSESYRSVRSDIVSLTSGYATSLKDYLSTAALFAPTTPGATGPTLVSAHFGTGDTGSAERAVAYATGDFTLVYGNCTASTNVSVELLHVGA
jgi:hypothetical protein